MPSTTSLSPSGRGSRFLPLGSVALNPAAISGVTIMKMISSTSMTSIIGVTLMSALTADDPESAVDMATAGHRLLGLEFLGEDRAPELASHALDQVVDQFLRGVGHLDRQVLDLGREVVVRPHRRNRDHETERRGDQCLGDTGRDARQAAGRALRRHAHERVHDTHRGAQQADERRRRADGAEHAEAALEFGKDDQHLTLHRPLGRVDVGGGDGGAVTQQRLHFGQRLAQHAGDVALLVLLGQRDGLVQVLFLNRARELRGKAPGFGLAALELDELGEHDREGVDRHDRHDDHDALREHTHLGPQVKQIETHVAVPPGQVLMAYWPTLNEMRCWTSWRTGWPLNLAGLKTPLRIASWAGSTNAGCVVLSTLNEFGSAWPVVSTTYCRSTAPAIPALCSTGG